MSNYTWYCKLDLKAEKAEKMKKEDKEFNEDNIKDGQELSDSSGEKGMKASKKVFYEIEIRPHAVYFGDLLYKRW